MTNDEIDKFARDLPSMTLHGNIPTETTMALAARVVELLDEKAKLDGWPPITNVEEANLRAAADLYTNLELHSTAEVILRLLRRPPDLNPIKESDNADYSNNSPKFDTSDWPNPNET